MSPRATKEEKATDAKGLAPEVATPKLVPAVLPGDLGLPTLVKYNGWETRQSRNYAREQKLYMFQLPQEQGGAVFALWGNVQLDLKLRQIPRTALCVIQYLGKGDGDRAQHQWSVRHFRGTSAQLQELKREYSEGAEVVAQAVALLEQASLAGTGNGGQDDDLPF